MTPLVCVIATLGGGGAERVMTWLASALADERPVTVVTLDRGDAAPFFPLSSRVSRIGLDVLGDSASPASAARRAVTTWWRLRRAIRPVAPGTVVAFVDRTNVTTILACAGLGMRVVVSERADPILAAPGRAWSVLRRVAYQLADAVVVQTEWTRDRLAAAGVPGRSVVIPNPVPVVPTAEGARRPVVLGMGRFTHQKGFDVLLRAFAAARSSLGPEWTLRIAGAGPDEAALRALADRLRLGDAVTWPGRVTPAAAEFASASVFVLASRFEGFPNVLAEAMAAGVACIATDCPTGPRDLVTDGLDGRLVEVDDVTALAQALIDLCQNADTRERVGAAARLSTRRFSEAIVLRRWREVIDAQA